MVTFLSQEWLDLNQQLAADLPARPGATLRLQIVVSGAPDGEVVYSQRIEDGRIRAATLGPDADAEVVLTQTYADALAIANGDLELDAGIMQGRVKMTGTTGDLMAILPLIQSPEYRALLAELAAKTET